MPATTINIPVAALPVGAHLIGPFSVPQGVTRAALTLDRTVAGGLNQLTVTDQVGALVETSRDGGASWVTLCGVGTVGGTSLDDTGMVVPNTILDATLTAPADTQTKVRVTVTVNGGIPITVQGSLALS